MKFHVVSIKQPWPHAIIHFGKAFENRSWKLPEQYLNKTLLIHAGKKIDEQGRALLQDNGFRLPADLPTGGIVGFVRFDKCLYKNWEIWADPESYNWRIAAAGALPFLACKGQLGFFEVDYPHEVPA